MAEDHTNRPPAPSIFGSEQKDSALRENLPIPTTFDGVAWAEYALSLEKRLGIGPKPDPETVAAMKARLNRREVWSPRRA